MVKNIRRIKKRDETVTGVSVLDAVNDYLHTPHVKRLSPETRKEYHQELGVFARWCQTHTLKQDQKNRSWIAVDLKEHDTSSLIALHQIDEQAVYCFVEHLRLTHKPNQKTALELSSQTLAGYVRVIKVFLNWCLSDQQYRQHVQAIAVQRIEKPPVIETIKEIFTADQVEALYEACDKEESEHLQLRDKAILATLLGTGIRAKELVTLKIGHTALDVKDPHIRVFGKGSKWGEVGLGEKTRRALQKYIRTFRIPTIEHEVQGEHKNMSARQLQQITSQVVQQSVVFMNRYGKPLTVSGLEQILVRLGRRVGIERKHCTPHICRHWFSVNFIRQGGDIYRLSKLLRHSSVSVTENYLKSFQQTEARHGARDILDSL